MRWTTWITPAFPVIAAPDFVELQANSVEHAVMQIRARYPNCGYSMPRADGPDYDFRPSVPGCFDELETMKGLSA